jgi:hypothetical protein
MIDNHKQRIIAEPGADRYRERFRCGSLGAVRVRDVTSVAVDDAGRIFCADRAGVARLEGGRLVAHGRLGPRARVASIAARPGGGVVLVDAYENRLLEIDGDGRVAPLAGRPQPPALDARPRRSDGPAAEALFRAPDLVVATPERVFCVELPQPEPVVRRLERGSVDSVVVDDPELGAVVAAAAGTGGRLFLAGATGPFIALLEPDGRTSLVAGSPDAAGETDGEAREARFARITALAAAPDGGLVVADGARLRRLGPDGCVTALTAARFEPIRAVAVAADGAAIVADGALWRVAPSGEVEPIARDAPAERGGRATAKAFGAAIVDGDTAAAWRIAESLLAAHAATGRARPNRAVQPVSVASARVGRELALAWAESSEPDRARLGAFCLWLIRSEEGRGAPRADAVRLVGALDRTLAAAGRTDAVRAADVVRIAFGDLARRRDRLAVAEALRGSHAAGAVPHLLASPDPDARRLGVEIAAQSRDIRFTPALAALAPDHGALGALRRIWEAPAYTRAQVEDLRAGLRFGRATLDRLFETHGPSALGARGTARYRRLLDGAPESPGPHQ